MLRVLLLLVGIMPLIGVSAAYWLNVQAGVLPGCLPPLDGCTSISSTGRYWPGSLPFKAVLLPQAAFLAILWWSASDWLKQVSSRPGHTKVILISGVVGAAALVVYVSLLGSQQPFYEFMRRFGIYFYFLGTAISQVALTWALPKSSLRTAMLFAVGTPFALGLANLAQKSLLIETDLLENRIEWIAALMMQFWFVLFYFVVARTDSSND